MLKVHYYWPKEGAVRWVLPWIVAPSGRVLLYHVDFRTTRGGGFLVHLYGGYNRMGVFEDRPYITYREDRQGD